MSLLNKDSQQLPIGLAPNVGPVVQLKHVELLAEKLRLESHSGHSQYTLSKLLTCCVFRPTQPPFPLTYESGLARTCS